jgi:preprotein translocase SecE subunit
MIARTKKYIQEIQLEWQKVSKPDWKDVQGNTIVVLIACAILAFFLWLVDGQDTFPVWFSTDNPHSIYGIFLLVIVIPLCVYFITRNLTPYWKLIMLASFAPLAIVLIIYFVFNYPIQGFGMALLREWFLR